MKLTPLAWLIIVVVIGGIVAGSLFKAGIIQKAGDKVAQTTHQKSEPRSVTKIDGKDEFVACINTWGGFAGMVHFNRGFELSKLSQFWTMFKLPVRIKLEDNFEVARDGFKSGNFDALWTTVDTWPTELDNLMPVGAKLIYMVDRSFGGDVVLVRPGINSINDLKGKKIATMWPAPSSTLLLTAFTAAGMSISDAHIIKCKTEPEAVDMFKAGEADAVVCWSPDYLDGVRAVPGSHLLFNTRQHAPNAIVDALYVKEETLNKRFDDVKNFVKGCMIGAAQVNNDPSARAEAAQELSTGFGLSPGWCDSAIACARISTFGDNVQFFNLRGDNRGLTAEALYASSYRMYKNNPYVGPDGVEEKVVPDQLPTWRNVSDMRVLQAILADGDLNGPEQAPQRPVRYAAPSPALASAPALTSKPLTVNFASGSATLTDEAKLIIQQKFVPDAQKLEGMYVRIEGNTDNIGEYAYNKRLSLRRAHSVANYLVSTYGWPANRFIYVGNGPDKPVPDVDSNSDEGRAACRRTDFQFIPDPNRQY